MDIGLSADRSVVSGRKTAHTPGPQLVLPSAAQVTAAPSAILYYP